MNPVCCPVSAIPVVNLSEASLAPLAPKQTITIDWSTCLVSSRSMSAIGYYGFENRRPGEVRIPLVARILWPQ